MKITFRSKDGKITSVWSNMRFIFSVKVGKRTFKTRKQIKKYVLRTRKERKDLKKKKIKKVKPSLPLEFIITERKYQTQIDKLGGYGYTHRFETIIQWFNISTETTFVDTFKRFLTQIKKMKKIPKNAYRIRLGVTLQDDNSGQAVSEFGKPLVYFFDLKQNFDEILETIFENVSKTIDRILELAQRYLVINLDTATLHALFTVQGKLK